MFDQESDIGKAFSEYWSNEHTTAFKKFVQEHGLKEIEFQELVS